MEIYIFAVHLRSKQQRLDRRSDTYIVEMTMNKLKANLLDNELIGDG
jgi:hypothetical protein